MNLELTRPDARDKSSFLAALSEMQKPSDRASWIYMGEAFPENEAARDFDGYVQQLLRRESEPPAGFVRDTVYWGKLNGEVVGRIAVRHELNEFLSRVGGHIGYITRPSARRKGIASEMLAQLLRTERARAIGRLLLTCDESNDASQKTILKNGGRFESLLDMGADKPRKMRFWIELK